MSDDRTERAARHGLSARGAEPAHPRAELVEEPTPDGPVARYLRAPEREVVEVQAVVLLRPAGGWTVEYMDDDMDPVREAGLVRELHPDADVRVVTVEVER